MEKLTFGILRCFVLYMIKLKQVRVSHPSQTYISLSSFSYDLLVFSYRLLS